MGSLWIVRPTQFFPLPCGSKPFEIEKGAAIQGGTGSSEDSNQSNQGLFIDLVSSHQIPVVPEISQEPSQFPERLGGAIEPSGNGMAKQLFGFENGESKDKERSLRMPAVKSSFDADQEDTFEDVRVPMIFAM
jgi:hypothetical protein